MTSAGDDEGSTETLIQRLRQLTVETDRFAEMFGEAQRMHRTDLNALAVIMDSGLRGHPVSPGELAASLHLSASATTTVLDRLEAVGHVRRERSAHDRRRVEVRVEDQALEVGRALFAPLGAAYARAWETFTDDERRTIARFLAVTIDATVRTRSERFVSGQQG